MGNSSRKSTAHDFEDLQRICIAADPQLGWRFTADTISSLDSLWERWYTKPPATRVVAHVGGSLALPWSERLRELFPSSLQQKHLGLYEFQWISLCALVLLGFLADAVVRIVLHQVTAAWFRSQRTKADEQMELDLWKPIGLLAQALVWYGGTVALGLPTTVVTVLLAGLQMLAVIAAVRTLFRLIDLLVCFLGRRALTTATGFDDLLMPLISKALKGVVVSAGILACAETFRLPVTGILGGLGIGGAALAFASKDAISNLFGSFTVLLDRPFEIGDFIIADGVEGTVERVGFRSTRVRTFNCSLMTVPNSLFTNAIVDNMGRRQYRRFKTLLNIQYDSTPMQIEAFCEGVRELIRINPRTRKDQFHVYLHEMSESSIDILFDAYFDTKDRAEELQQRHNLLLEIMGVAERLGVHFAYPTRTLHVFDHAAAADATTDERRKLAA